jgi:hypothetical protein
MRIYMFIWDTHIQMPRQDASTYNIKEIPGWTSFIPHICISFASAIDHCSDDLQPRLNPERLRLWLVSRISFGCDSTNVSFDGGQTGGRASGFDPNGVIELTFSASDYSLVVGLEHRLDGARY